MAEPGVLWIEAEQHKQPLCDVPWLGRALVLSTGDVNFCCFSKVAVGNIREMPFEEIWRGPAMQRIRRELTERRLPAECQSTSCPIYRGDSLSFLVSRLRRNEEELLRSVEIRKRLMGSTVSLHQDQVGIGGAIDINIELRSDADTVLADLFIGIQQASGVCRFLPDYDYFPVPFAPAVSVIANEPKPIKVRARIGPAGQYQICAALFAPDSNPNFVENCYWSGLANLAVASAVPSIADDAAFRRS